MDTDPRAAYAAQHLSDQVQSDNPLGAPAFVPLASAWLPTRSVWEDGEPDRGHALLVLLATPTGQHDAAGYPVLADPYFVAIHDTSRVEHLAPGTYRAVRHRDLVAVEEVPTYSGALAAYAARLTGIAVEALTDGHGL